MQREMKNVHKILVGKPERRDHWKNVGVDRRIILECILEKEVWKVWHWIHLAQDRDQWRTVVNTVMILRVLKNRTIS
jgi:hypothetical protein